MKNKAYYLLSLTLFFSLFLAKGYSQTTTPATTPTPPPAVVPPVAATQDKSISRPSGSLGVPEVDNYVTNCYNLYDQTNSISTQLNTIEQKVMTSKLSKLDVDALDAQMASFNKQLIGLRGVGLQLLQSGSEMTDNAVKGLKSKPLKIPSAVVRVKNATKAVKASLKNINTMLTVTIVDIEKRLHPKSPADTTQNKLANGAANTGKTAKTSISITGIGFSVFNSFSNELNNMPNIKSTSKKFSSSGRSEIDVVHYGTTDDLLNAILLNCKDVLSEKNIGGSEKGKISLVF